ncbi:MAG TPA: DUF6542 domain-containing protein [Pseudonocardiaceae bacterium]|nr:DUF6542 domain-containing protein [Pseudonocardiaceae bacterium]
MTATSDRRRDPHVGFDVAGWGQRSAFGSAKGWPWWAAVLLALGLSIAGAIIDMHTSGSLAKVFDGAYFIGCVGAVCLVRRRNLFGPMVQAPLILAVTVPVVVVLTKGMPSGSGMASKLIALGVPLVTGFPTMAITTGATVIIGGIRFLVQRKPAGADRDDDGRGSRPTGARADRDDEAGDRPNRSAQDRRQRPAGSGRPNPDRAARDDRAAPRDRTRMPPAASRSEAPDRSGRAAAGRSSADRDRDRDRGQQPRSGQSRDRAQPPRTTGRSSRDDGRRQPPPRRHDDDY